MQFDAVRCKAAVFFSHLLHYHCYLDVQALQSFPDVEAQVMGLLGLLFLAGLWLGLGLFFCCRQMECRCNQDQQQPQRPGVAAVVADGRVQQPAWVLQVPAQKVQVSHAQAQPLPQQPVPPLLPCTPDNDNSRSLLESSALQALQPL